MATATMKLMVEAIEVKTCSHCKAIKRLSEFSRSAKNKDGRNNQCKQCSNESSKRWSQTHRERARDNLRRSRQNRYPDVDIVYAIWSTVHNSVIYIGSTTVTLTERMAKHKYDAFVANKDHGLYEAMREYGWDNFKFFVINDEDSEKFNENYYIRMMNPMFNMMSGLKTRRYRSNAKAN